MSQLLKSYGNDVRLWNWGQFGIEAEYSFKFVLKTEPGINYREPVTQNHCNDNISIRM